MRKNIFKKVVATLATAAMALGMLVNPNSAMEVKASDTTVYLYGGFNNWTADNPLTSTDGVTYTGEITIAIDDDLYILNDADAWTDSASITSLNGSASYTKDGRDCVWFGGSGDNAGTYVITYNKSTGEMTSTLKAASTVTYTYEYWVAGATAFEAESWSKSNPDEYGTTGKMTANGSTYTYTATTTASFDGSEGYNIIKIGTPDDGSAKTLAWLKDTTTNAAFACSGKGAGTLTITFNADDETSTCTFVAANTNNNADDDDDTDNTNTNNNTNTNTNTNTDNSGANTNTNTDTNNNSAPITSDVTSVAMLAVVAALAATAVIVMKKRTVNE